MNAEINLFVERIKQRLVNLPGESVQMQMAPFIRKPLNFYTEGENFNPKESAVAVIVFREDNDHKIVAIQRQTYDGFHSNQIAFPGGKRDAADESLYHTSVRELNEELGVLEEGLIYAGQLSKLYIPVSNFMVYPFLFFAPQKPLLSIATKEVAEVLNISVSKELILSENKIQEKVQFSAGLTGVVPGYKIQNKFIWGATAMILREVEEIVKL